MMNEYLKKIGKLIALVVLASTIPVTSPIYAQSAPSEPVPEPPPSVNDFSLTPGGDQTSPQPVPEEPADSQPAMETTPPATIGQPETVAPQPSVSAPPSISPSPAPATNSRQPAPTRPQPRQTIRPAAENPVPQQQLPGTTDEAEPATQPEESDQRETPIPDAPLEQAIPDTETPAADDSYNRDYLLPVGLILALLVVGGAGLVIWRRKKNKIPNEAPEFNIPPVEPSADSRSGGPIDLEPTPMEEVPAPLPNPPAIKTAPEPVRENNGFITSKVAKAPPARQSVSQPEPTKLDQANHLEIIFIAKHASSTLMNAVVGYQIDIKNLSNGPIQNLQISGAMIQADHSVVDSASTSQGLLLEKIENLAAGKSEMVNGEIRLPLSSFSPIIFQSQKLMVPLVLLRFDYGDQDGNAHVQTANFLIGTEHVPPRSKMVPFRLDQGPRNYKNVSQRPFQS